jgi:hypothetical protein
VNAKRKIIITNSNASNTTIDQNDNKSTIFRKRQDYTRVISIITKVKSSGRDKIISIIPRHIIRHDTRREIRRRELSIPKQCALAQQEY